MNLEEVKRVLEENAYIIRQHINYCGEHEKAVPLRAYTDTIKILGELTPTQEKLEDQRLLYKEEKNIIQEQTIEVNAISLLLESGLFYDNQVRHPKNKSFIKSCNEYLNQIGVTRFKQVLNRVKYRVNKGNVKNVYPYLLNALKTEQKQGEGNAYD